LHAAPDIAFRWSPSVFLPLRLPIAAAQPLRVERHPRQRLKKIMDRPEFAHSRFGIKFISAETGIVFYELNSPQLFVPGSTLSCSRLARRSNCWAQTTVFPHQDLPHGTDREGRHAARRSGARGERRLGISRIAIQPDGTLALKTRIIPTVARIARACPVIRFSSREFAHSRRNRN